MTGRCTGGQHHPPVDGGHCPCGVVSRHPVAVAVRAGDEEIVAALAEALHGSLCSCEAVDAGTGFFIRSADADKATAALLPVVRRVAEQRAAEAVQPVLDLADELEADAQLQVDDSDSLPSVVGRSWVNAARQFRAAALTATPNHGTDAT